MPSEANCNASHMAHYPAIALRLPSDSYRIKLAMTVSAKGICEKYMHIENHHYGRGIAVD